MSEKFRCFGDTPIYIDYHDNEWGRPVHNDIKLFEMLILEGAQAGLSWITVLKKRDAYREAFDGFDPQKVALYDDVKFEELMANAGIIRNRLKINAAITNAKLFLKIQEEYGSFDKFIWDYVNHTPIIGHWETLEDMPITTSISDRISKDLKKLGFKFVGSTIIYSFMQAVGMVNDHLRSCCVYDEILCVELCGWKPEDAADLTAAINNKKVLDNLRDGIPYPYTEKDAGEFIAATLAAEKNSQYAFSITYGGKVIGSIGVFRKENVHRLTAELGYYIAEPYWGKGIMTEAVRRMCEFIFMNTDIIRIFAEPYAHNEASCRVLEKAGFQFEGILRKNALKNGQAVDMNMYAILCPMR